MGAPKDPRRVGELMTPSGWMPISTQSPWHRPDDARFSGPSSALTIECDESFSSTVATSDGVGMGVALGTQKLSLAAHCHARMALGRQTPMTST